MLKGSFGVAWCHGLGCCSTAAHFEHKQMVVKAVTLSFEQRRRFSVAEPVVL
jgi:hypothetical protein